MDHSYTPAIRRMLSGPITPYIKSELSDIGINVIRQYADKMGWSRTDMGTLLREEMGRCRQAGCTASLEGLHSYYRVSRCGSHYRISRAVRAAIFAQLVGRGVLA